MADLTSKKAFKLSVFQDAPPVGKLAILKYLCEQKINVLLCLNTKGKDFIEKELNYKFAIEEYSRGLSVSLDSFDFKSGPGPQVYVANVTLLKKADEKGKKYIPLDTPLVVGKRKIPIIFIDDVIPILSSSVSDVHQVASI